VEQDHVEPSYPLSLEARRLPWQMIVPEDTHPGLFVITVIIIIIIISFMHGIYTYIPERNYVPREYSVAAILLLIFMVLISLFSVLNLFYFYISTLRSMGRVAQSV